MNARPNISVREIEPGEADSWTRTIAPLFDAYRVFYRKASDIAAAERWLWDRLSRSEAKIFVATLPESAATPILAESIQIPLAQVRDGVFPLGFALLYPGFTSVGLATRWTLNDLFVDPAFRRHGVGRLLTLRAMLQVQADSSAAIQLLTEHTNTSAQAMYTALGWQRDTDYQRWTWKPPGA